MPGLDKEGKLSIDGALFKFDNPIFQKHFGEGFKSEVITAKEAQRQRIFDTAFKVLQIASDIYLEASSAQKSIEEKQRTLWEEKNQLTDKEDKKAKDEELHAVSKEISILRKKKDVTGSLIYNFSFSIFKKNLNQWNLKDLTPEQENMIADYIVRDEKGLFFKMFDVSRYTTFCDFLGILSQQTENVISGNYKLTDMMQVVATNIGYETPIDTRENIKAFVREYDENIQNRYRTPKYMWYLHTFDVMQYLEKTPDIDIYSLSTVITNIAVSPPDANSDSQEVAQASLENYERFVIQSNLIPLISKAINFQKNYNDLSFDEQIATADSLATLRHQMAKLLQEKLSNGYGGSKIVISPEHKKFLDLLDKNIRGVLRKAQHQALQQDDALEKMTQLYLLYNLERECWSSYPKRNAYLAEIKDKEKSPKRISALSENPDFWPKDVLEHVKSYVFASNIFLDDIMLKDKILNNILDKLERLPSGKKKNECFFILLDNNVRASYPETRERLFDIYSKDIVSKLGQDDGSEKYQKRLAVYLKALDDSSKDDDRKKDWDIGEKYGNDNLLSNSISAADKYILLRQVSDEILSQEVTSAMIKEVCRTKLNSENLAASYFYGVGIDALTSEMDKNPVSANKFIQFLNSKGEAQDCREISSYIEDTMRDRYKNNEALVNILRNIQPINCNVLYENFWSAPLEVRAVIIARMLKSAVNVDSDDKNKEQQSWERVFDVVMDNMISPNDISTESQYARDIMHSYIKARSDYERELILSAMMVANRNIGKDAGNVGKALKLFLENMGPAEIKLGQAIASHPNTPEKIRIELQELKNSADKPARWIIYDWIRLENIPEEFWKEKYLGRILGSASYYTTIALGDDEVLRILRPEAREKAVKGFRVIGDMVADLQKKNMTKDLDYTELTSSVSEMVTQASRMSSIETNHDIGQKQYEYAQEVCNGVKLRSGNQIFPLKVMDWRAKGKNWIIMDRAKGVVFNDLPEETPTQIAYKKAFAKSYILFELSNIISGGKFDHDRHGAQLCINPDTNEVGIFDTGAMALREPTIEEQKRLGHVIYVAIKRANKEKNFMNLSDILNEKIEELYKNGVDTQYLVEVKKGILALGDFFNILDENDIAELISEMDIYSYLSEHIKSGIDEKMSLVEKAKLKIFMSTMVVEKEVGIAIIREQIAVANNNVENITISPAVESKSSWLQQVFTDNKENINDNNEENNSSPEFTNSSLSVINPRRNCVFRI